MHPEIPSILSPPSLTQLLYVSTFCFLSHSWSSWQRTLCKAGELRVKAKTTPNKRMQKRKLVLHGFTVFQVTLDHFSAKQSQSPRLRLFTSKTTNQLVPGCCMLLQCARLEEFEHPIAMLEYSEYFRISQNSLTFDSSQPSDNAEDSATSDLFAEARPFQLDFARGHVMLQSFLLSLGPNRPMLPCH